MAAAAAANQRGLLFISYRCVLLMVYLCVSAAMLEPQLAVEVGDSLQVSMHSTMGVRGPNPGLKESFQPCIFKCLFVCLFVHPHVRNLPIHLLPTVDFLENLH